MYFATCSDVRDKEELVVTRGRASQSTRVGEGGAGEGKPGFGNVSLSPLGFGHDYEPSLYISRSTHSGLSCFLLLLVSTFARLVIIICLVVSTISLDLPLGLHGVGGGEATISCGKSSRSSLSYPT